MSERMAVVGAGVMGRNHARTISSSEYPGSLSYVVDANIDRARELAQLYGDDETIATTEISRLQGDDVSGAVVASPSVLHTEHATELMRNGVDVLIEKPVAKSLEEASEIAQVAHREGRVAMVGHVELFNPTVEALRILLGKKAISSIRFDRLGKVDDQSRLYDNVVSDLMVHDLSIAMRLVEGSYEANQPMVVSAFGKKDSVAAPDPAEAIIEFPNGIDAHFRNSRRYSGGKVRTVAVETDTRVVTADLLAKDVTVLDSEAGEYSPEGVYKQQINSTQYYPSNGKQPLARELDFFLECIRKNKSPEDAQVSVENATQIMRITDKILSIIHNN